MDDMRQLLETAKGEAPPPRYAVDDVIAAGRRRQRWVITQRVGGGVVAAAIASAAVLVGTHLAVGRQTQPDPVLPAEPVVVAVDVPPLTFMFDTYSAGAYKVLRPTEVTTTYQRSDIATEYQDSAGKTVTAYVGELFMYRPGVRLPAEFSVGTKVTVNGMLAYAGQRERYAMANMGNPPAPKFTVATLAWQYAPDSWAVVSGYVEFPADADRRMTAADERALAEKFTLGAGSRARMPFQTGYLPTGWQVVKVEGRGEPGTIVVTVIFAPAASAGTDKIRDYSSFSDDGTAVVITIGEQQTTPVPDAPKQKSTCGHLETDTDLWCSWNIPHTRYFVQLHDPASQLSQAELTKIKDGLVFDAIDKPDTWHPVP
jgi:hypothetical protein